jgi:hypothetical protein
VRAHQFSAHRTWVRDDAVADCGIGTLQAVAALGVFLGMHVNTKDFDKIRQNSVRFGKTVMILSK